MFHKQQNTPKKIQAAAGQKVYRRFVKSKGTLNSINALLNTYGYPENSLRITEFLQFTLLFSYISLTYLNKISVNSKNMNSKNEYA